MKTILIMVVLLAASSLAPIARASDNATNEMARAVAGIGTGAFATLVADRMEVKQRAWIGFFASSALGIPLAAASTNARHSSFAGNLIAHVVGSAMGAFATDGFLVRPVVTRNYADRGVTFGLYATLAF